MNQSELAELAAAAAADPDGVDLGAGSSSILARVVRSLTERDTSSKIMLSALTALCNLATTRSRRRRRLIMSAIEGGVDGAFEARLAAYAKKAHGARRRHHELLLLLLIRLRSYNLRAHEWLEMVGNRVPLAVEVIGSLVRVSTYGTGETLNVLRLVHGLTKPETYLMIGVLDDDVSQRIDRLVLALTGSGTTKTLLNDAVASYSRHFSPQCSPSPSAFITPTQHQCASEMMRAVKNLYLYAEKDTVALRQHLLVSTRLARGMLLPYIEDCALLSPSIALREHEAKCFVEDPLLEDGLLLAFRILALLSFRMPRGFVFEEAAGDRATTALMTNASDFCRSNPRTVAAALFFNTNADSFNEAACQDAGSRISALESLLAAHTVDEVQTLHSIFALERSWLPVSRDNKSYAIILKCLQVSAARDDSAGNVEVDYNLSTFGEWLRERENGAETKAAGSSGAPKHFLCAINRHIMKEPVLTPDGVHFEKATIIHWLEEQGSVCPITHNPLTLRDLKPDRELARTIALFHVQKSMGRVKECSEEKRLDDVYDF